MKIWILTARFGNGHYSAAKALEEEYQEQGHQVIVSDIIEILYPKLSKLIYRVFNDFICRSNTVYNFANSFGRNPHEESGASPLLTAAFERINPDMVITTWSGCARKLGKVPVPVYVCITDIGVHKGWISPTAQGYLVATTDVAEKLKALGVSNHKIYIRGIPVKKAFRRLPYKIKRYTKAKNLLIMGGGLGILPWIDKLLDVLCNNPDLQITVIVGRNHRLYRRLQRKYPSITVVGFTDNVSSYLTKADLLISKPGGVSLFESIYATTPCVTVLPTYQHEIENAVFIQKHDIGEVVWSKQEAAEQIMNLIQNEALQNRYQQNIARMKREIEAARNDYANAV